MKKSISSKAKFIKSVSLATVIFNIVTIPLFVCFYLISMNSKDLADNAFVNVIANTISIQILLLAVALIILFLITKKINKKRIIGYSCVVAAYIIELTGIMTLVYSDNSTFKKWLIETSMNTFNYQYLATTLYNDTEINKVLSEHIIQEEEYLGIDTFDDIEYNQAIYANKYEEEILKREEGQIYKIIKVKGTTKHYGNKYEGYLVAVYDPSKVSVATSEGAGTEGNNYGETIETIARKNNAVLAINAGGWYDPFWSSNGGIPHGLVISNKEFKSYYNPVYYNGGIIGFDDKNRLVLKSMSQKEALESGIRDCVDFGPYLIVNGKNRVENEIGSWGYQPRTAIAQRKDGIVLFLVIDGRQEHSTGAALEDLAEILMNYGAYNASNLDGGTSSTLVEKGKVINNPHNGRAITIRSMPNAFVVKE